MGGQEIGWERGAQRVDIQACYHEALWDEIIPTTDLKWRAARVQRSVHHSAKILFLGLESYYELECGRREIWGKARENILCLSLNDYNYSPVVESCNSRCRYCCGYSPEVEGHAHTPDSNITAPRSALFSA